jgi:hypothetical protein
MWRQSTGPHKILSRRIETRTKKKKPAPASEERGGKKNKLYAYMMARIELIQVPVLCLTCALREVHDIAAVNVQIVLLQGLLDGHARQQYEDPECSCSVWPHVAV